MSEAPSDLTPGEIWRLLISLRDEVVSLPDRISKELDARDKRAEVQVDLKVAPLEKRVSFLEKVVWSTVAFLLVTVVGVAVSLVLPHISLG